MNPRKAIVVILAAALCVLGVIGEAQQPSLPRPKSKVQPTAKAQPAPPRVDPAAPAPAPPNAPIPFAPIGPGEKFEQPPVNPQIQPEAPKGQEVGQVTIFIEITGHRFLVFDDKGWLPDVKEISLNLSVDRPMLMDAVMYPGAYAPTTPKTITAPMPVIKLLTTEEFQAKLDEANGPPQEPLAQK